MKVLYIAGWGRSGSTILGRILGQAEGFFSVGELRYVWDRGVVENRLCSCGAPFMDCPVWRSIIDRVLDAESGPDAGELVELRERGLRTRHVLLTPTQSGLQTKVARMAPYAETLGRLYGAVQDVTQSRVIVDASKFPSYAYILKNVPGIEVYVVHLVRDPRAVAYSWASRRKPELDRGTPAELMTSHGLFESSLAWGEWNLALERTWRRDPERYMLLRYEDFVRSPRAAVREVLRAIGEGEADLPFLDERRVSLEASHTFSGNPNRFSSGTVAIRADEEWRQAMSTTRRAAVTVLTLPGLMRYGYRLWP